MKLANPFREGSGAILWGVLFGGLGITVVLDWLSLTHSGHSPGLSLPGFQALLGLAAGLGLAAVTRLLGALLSRREGHYRG